jgi:SAM-dependent methyltransferase
MELLVGSGANTKKRMWLPGHEEWTELVTLDMNPDHKPDVVWDLTKRPLPFDDNHFDEVHAYEVLEHIGQQGDWRAFFEEWSEWWRILKPGGHLYACSPVWSSEGAWGDPGHTRVMSIACLTFLVQTEYTKQIGTTPMTDYRFVYKADFDLLYSEERGENFLYIMQAVKPSRCP